MGDVIPIGPDGDMEPGADVLDNLRAWLEFLASGAAGRPVSLVLVVEVGDGLVHHASASALRRFDLARRVGILDLAMARLRAEKGYLLDLEPPGTPPL